jgi:hypothetical protein
VLCSLPDKLKAEIAIHVHLDTPFMLVIILPTLPTIVANIRTPMRKSTTTNKNSMSRSGVGVSPIVVNVKVDYWNFLTALLLEQALQIWCES